MLIKCMMNQSCEMLRFAMERDVFVVRTGSVDERFKVR